MEIQLKWSIFRGGNAGIITHSPAGEVASLQLCTCEFIWGCCPVHTLYAYIQGWWQEQSDDFHPRKVKRKWSSQKRFKQRCLTTQPFDSKKNNTDVVFMVFLPDFRNAFLQEHHSRIIPSFSSTRGWKHCPLGHQLYRMENECTSKQPPTVAVFGPVWGVQTMKCLTTFDSSFAKGLQWLK